MGGERVRRVEAGNTSFSTTLLQRWETMLSYEQTIKANNTKYDIPDTQQTHSQY